MANTTMEATLQNSVPVQKLPELVATAWPGVPLSKPSYRKAMM
jgi:hypothetical protein